MTLLLLLCSLLGAAYAQTAPPDLTALPTAIKQGPVQPEMARTIATNLRPLVEAPTVDPLAEVLYWSAVVLGDSEGSRLQGHEELVLYDLRRLYEAYEHLALDPAYPPGSSTRFQAAYIVVYALARQSAACPEPIAPGGSDASQVCSEDHPVDLVRLALARSVAESTPREGQPSSTQFKASALELLLPHDEELEQERADQRVRVPGHDPDSVLRLFLLRHHLFYRLTINEMDPSADIELLEAHLNQAMKHGEAVGTFGRSPEARALAALMLAEVHLTWPELTTTGGLEAVLEHRWIAAMRAYEALAQADALGTNDIEIAHNHLSRALEFIAYREPDRDGDEATLEVGYWTRDLRSPNGLDARDLGTVEVAPLSVPGWSLFDDDGSVIARVELPRDWVILANAALSADTLAGAEDGDRDTRHDEFLVFTDLTVVALNDALTRERLAEDERQEAIDYLDELRLRATDPPVTGTARYVPARSRATVQALDDLRGVLAAAPPLPGQSAWPVVELHRPSVDLDDLMVCESLLVEHLSRVTSDHLRPQAEADLAASAARRNAPQSGRALFVLVPAFASYSAEEMLWLQHRTEGGSPGRQEGRASKAISLVISGLEIASPKGRTDVDVVQAWLVERGAELTGDTLVPPGAEFPWVRGPASDPRPYAVRIVASKRPDFATYASAQDSYLDIWQAEPWGLHCTADDTADEAMCQLAYVAYTESLRRAGGGADRGLWFDRRRVESVRIVLPAPEGAARIVQNRSEQVSLRVVHGGGYTEALFLRDGGVVSPAFTRSGS